MLILTIIVIVDAIKEEMCHVNQNIMQGNSLLFCFNIEPRQLASNT